MIFKLFITALVALVPYGTVLANDSAEAMVKRVEKRIEGLKTLSASFQHTHEWQGSDRSQVLEGRIMLQKPYLLRIEYPGNTTVVDGKNVWTYLSRANQVQVSDYHPDEKEFPSPQSIFTTYAKNRKAESAGQDNVNERKCRVIKLLPNTREENRVTVWIDEELLFPVKTVEETPFGDITVIVLSDIVINGKIDPDVFRFTTPEGVDLIDLRG